MLSRLAFTLLAAASAEPAFAAYGPYDGGLPGEIYSYAAGARSMGMGRTFTAVADDATSAYWNAAGLAYLDQQSVTALYATLADKSQGSFAYIGYGLPVGAKMGFAAGLLNLSSGNYAGKDEFNQLTGQTYSVTQRGFYASGAYRALDELAIGVTIKGAQEAVATQSGFGFGLDLGAQYEPMLHMRLGLALVGVVPPQPSVGAGNDVIPTTGRLGISYVWLNHQLLTALDLDDTFHRSPKARVGLEYRPVAWAALRAGFNETEYTAGFGAALPFAGGEGSIDYALAISEIGMVHRASLAYAFGKSRGRPEVHVTMDQALFSPRAVIKRNRALFRVHTFDRSGIASWRLAIYTRDPRGIRKIKILSGKGMPSEVVEWDGKDEDKKIVGEGIYYYIFESVNGLGNRTVTEEQAFRVYPKPPEVKVD